MAEQYSAEAMYPNFPTAYAPNYGVYGAAPPTTPVNPYDYGAAYVVPPQQPYEVPPAPVSEAPAPPAASGGVEVAGNGDFVPPSAPVEKGGAGIPHSEGLTSVEAEKLLAEWGKNEIPSEETPLWKIAVGQFWGIMPLLMLLCCILAAVIQDWADLGIILALLLINACLGFYEQRKALRAMASLADGISHEISCKRDGEFKMIDATLLVPGDLVFLKGGQIIPADSYWCEGDEVLVDQAALTGESLPVKKGGSAKDEDGHPGSGKLLLSGAVLKQGECHAVVDKTGFNTMIGEAAAAANESESEVNGIFYRKILLVVKILVVIAVLDVIAVLLVLLVGRKWDWKAAFGPVIAILVASIPIALPLVMQVTLAAGSKRLADEKAIVTHLAALDEIAAMKVLCSDKTGTLTTAKMTVYMDKIWCAGNATQEEVMKYCGLGSNRKNIDDAIDSAIFRAFDKEFPNAKQLEAEYTETKAVGFNAIVKRTVTYLSHPTEGNIKIGKGLITKVLETGSDGGDEWVCANVEQLRPEVKRIDEEFATAGYKTIGVAISRNGGPMEFLGVVPMLDPPREDTLETIKAIRQGGVDVKMVTGDHLNIAKELARQIELGTNIYPNTKLWPASTARDALIAQGDGFAQVLPKDKHEVVTVLQKQGNIVGMTGDGVNDAPALTAANIGIAVADATDAARSAADIVLTEPGLSPIFTAVMESRRIFGRIRSYVYYRMAASIHVVLYLSLLIYAYNQEINSIYIVLLALLNDVTTITVAYDNVEASSRPVTPTVQQPLIVATTLGIMLFVQSYVWFLINRSNTWMNIHQDNAEYNSNLSPSPSLEEYDGYLHTVLFLQMFISVELLIFVTRSQTWFVIPRYPYTPAIALAVSVWVALIAVSIFCGTGVIFTKISWAAVGWTWLYCFIWWFIMDAVKMVLFWVLQHFGVGESSSDETGFLDAADADALTGAPGTAPVAIEVSGPPPTSAPHNNFGLSSSWRLPNSFANAPPGFAARVSTDNKKRTAWLKANKKR